MSTAVVLVRSMYKSDKYRAVLLDTRQAFRLLTRARAGCYSSTWLPCRSAWEIVSHSESYLLRQGANAWLRGTAISRHSTLICSTHSLYHTAAVLTVPYSMAFKYGCIELYHRASYTLVVINHACLLRSS